MTDTATYTTTKLCGRRVATHAVEPGKAGQKLTLTPDEAAFDLGQGAIVAADGKLPDAFGKTSEKTDALRAGIAEEQERYAAVRAGRSVEAAPAAGDPAPEPAPAKAPEKKPSTAPDPGAGKVS